MLATGAFIVSLLSAVFLLVLGVSCFVWPEQTRRFFGAFASSAALHLIEMALRLLAGSALIVNAPHMWGGGVVAIFGWTLVISSLILAILPWRFHQRFATAVMPNVLARLPLIGFVAGVGGLALVGALVLPYFGAP